MKGSGVCVGFLGELEWGWLMRGDVWISSLLYLTSLFSIRAHLV